MQIGSFIELAYGKALPKGQRKSGNIPVYGSGGINGYHDIALVAAPGIVVGRKGTVGSLFWIEDDFFPIDTVFYVNLLRNTPLYWIYEMLRSINIADLGADSAVPGVNRNSVYEQPIVYPNDNILFEYQRTIEPLIAANAAKIIQTETITALRDVLLPKLLSGVLQVCNVRKDLPVVN